MLTHDDRKELDFQKLGPVLESLVNSDRISDEERHAIELCARAAVDLLSIEHEHSRQEFYNRPDIIRVESHCIDRWLKENQNAAAGVSVLTHGRWYVSSYASNGKLQLTSIDPPWPFFPDDPE